MKRNAKVTKYRILFVSLCCAVAGIWYFYSSNRNKLGNSFLISNVASENFSFESSKVGDSLNVATQKNAVQLVNKEKIKLTPESFNSEKVLSAEQVDDRFLALDSRKLSLKESNTIFRELKRFFMAHLAEVPSLIQRLNNLEEKKRSASALESGLESDFELQRERILVRLLSEFAEPGSEVEVALLKRVDTNKTSFEQSEGSEKKAALQRLVQNFSDISFAKTGGTPELRREILNVGNSRSINESGKSEESSILQSQAYLLYGVALAQASFQSDSQTSSTESNAFDTKEYEILETKFEESKLLQTKISLLAAMGNSRNQKFGDFLTHKFPFSEKELNVEAAMAVRFLQRKNFENLFQKIETFPLPDVQIAFKKGLTFL